MPNRAIVISIANYPDADIDKQLPGTEESADKFHDWLVQEKQVAAADIVRLKDIDRFKLERAFRDLVDKGQDTTERLFVFFSGHGFSFQDAPGKQRPADILVGRDFENLQDSGHSCLKLDDLQDTLFNCLGPGEHFYFIDACRNLINASESRPSNIGWLRPPSALGTPAINTLFSTERLSMAVDNKVFAVQLVEGLSGKGRAKRYEGPRLVVTFNSLCDYLKLIRQRNIDYSTAGNGKGEIVEIQPIPSFQCRVDVVNAAPADQFMLTVQNARQQPIGAPQAFAGTTTSIQQPPDDYYLAVQHATDAVQPVASNHADLYDDCMVTFLKVVAAGPPPVPQPAVQPATVSLTASPGTTLLIENVSTGGVTRSDHAFDGPLEPGEYYVRLKASDGRTLRRRRFSVAAGGHAVVDVAARASSPVKDALLAAIPGQHDSSEVDFSETLGPMPDDDLGLWLSIIGASRIVGKQGEYRKLGQLPLPVFEHLPPGGSAVFMLLGLEKAPSEVSMSVSASAMKPDWTTFTTGATPMMPGVFAWPVDVAPGQRFISVRLGSKAPMTFASYALPNRVTLFTLVQQEDSTIGVHQFLLPASHLIGYLSVPEREFFQSPPLQGVRFIALAQKQLAARRRMRTEGWEQQNQWASLLDGKWLDPVMALMACFEMLRSGEGLGPVVLSNLTTYFGQLPDVAAVLKRAGGNPSTPDAVPIFLAGVRAFPDLQLPLPPGKLDFNSPWTSWVGAVL